MPIPSYVCILRIHGPFLFGATAKLEEATHDPTHLGPIIIVRLRNMTAIDGTGLHALESYARRVQGSGRTMIVCGARRQPAKLIRHSALPGLLGKQNILPHVDAALRRARQLHEGFDGVGEQLAKDLTSSSLS